MPLSGYCFVISQERATEDRMPNTDDFRRWIEQDQRKADNPNLSPRIREFYRGQVRKWKRFLAESQSK